MDLKNLEKKRNYKTPFWNLDIPNKTKTDINNKRQMNIAAKNHIFLNHFHKFANYIHMYTDAIKTNTGSGYAVITLANEYLY